MPHISMSFIDELMENLLRPGNALQIQTVCQTPIYKPVARDEELIKGAWPSQLGVTGQDVSAPASLVAALSFGTPKSRSNFEMVAEMT